MAAAVTGRRRWVPYLLLAPSLVFLGVFFATPMFQAFGLALQPSGDATGLSWEAVQRMTADPRFGRALTTTLLLVGLIIPVQFALAMGMALVVNAKLKGQDLWLYVFALPLGISELAAGIIWFAILTERGWMNGFLEGLGLLERPFIFLDSRSPILIILAIVVAESWRATSILMIILVAGLQGIPRDYGEAADVFGASVWQRIWHIVLPLLKPTIRVALILRTILAFQAFGVVLAIAGSGTNVLVGESYRWYTELRDPRVAAAYASLILLLSLLATGLFLLLIRSDEEKLA